MFFPGSRYESVDTHEVQDARGKSVRYKKIRFVSTPDSRREHTVASDERLDHISHEYYQDPERYWKICDANEALWPPDLVREPGRKLLIPPS